MRGVEADIHGDGGVPVARLAVLAVVALGSLVAAVAVALPSGDAAPLHFSASGGIATAARGSVEDVACVTDPSQPHTLAVVARPNDVRAKSGRIAAQRNRLYVASAVLDEAARKDDARRGARIRVLCEGGAAKVYDLVLPRRASAVTASNLVSDVAAALQARGVDPSAALVALWVDAKPYGSMTGFASGGMSIAFRHAGWDTVLHEWLHVLGAVRPAAPNATPGRHCTDGLDVMCYADGSGGGPQRSVCTDMRVDCGGDDYFDASPAAEIGRAHV